MRRHHLRPGPVVMTWCLSWWNPSGVTEVLIAVVFWAGVAAVGHRAWTQHRTARSQQLTTDTTGDRHEAAATVDQAPRTGAGSRSTR